MNGSWSAILEILKQTVTEIAFSTYIVHLSPVDITNNTYILKTTDDFYLGLINNKYLNNIKSAVNQVLPQINDVKIVLEYSTPEIKPITPNNNQLKDNNINSNFIFSSFVVGESNRLAHAAAVAVAENPGNAYNPLFLYGDVGLGKTHLMHAIANHVLINNPNSRVAYSSCEKFLNELVSAIKENNTDYFREKYRNIDILLIDDIQFISDKTQTQVEFFHTFNDLKDSGKQIIMSSDRPPNEIKDLEARLRSRFASGLQADIKMPDFETRTAILEKKAESLNISIPKEVSQFIAQSIKSSIRELEGALTRVLAFSNLSNKTLNLDVAEEALKNIIEEDGTKITIEYIKEVVAKHYGIKIEEIQSKKRNQPVADARQVAMYFSRELLNDSLSNVGKQFNRDHTTVIHAVDKITEKSKNNLVFKNELAEIEKKITK